tara:strand:+ start:7145 stop:7423 length:279 start_codon:yes stop_codon:yes gene_type:complete
MFILTDKKTNGVYAVRDDSSVERVVQIFLDKDDAVRYYDLLKAIDYPRTLEVTEVEEDQVKENCKMHGYAFTLISPDEFVIPPQQNDNVRKD